MSSRTSHVPPEAVDPSNPSVIRRFLMWWMGWPANPYVSANAAVDFTAARAYLARLNEGEGPRVSVQHLLCAAVGRTLAAWPMANARIRGHRIIPCDTVGVAMPVNLLGHAEGRRREVGMVVVEDAGRASLRDIAARTRKTVNNEREGRTDNLMMRAMLGLAERTQGPVLHRVLDAVDRAAQHPVVDARMHRMAPVTSGLTNPGSSFAAEPGMLFRGGAIQVPMRMVHIATLWGVSAIQDEVIAVEGRAEVRPMLPVLLVFDHRLVDGVLASRLLLHLHRILQNPAESFGEDGLRQSAA
jgi:pyruvate/2-oxoglutarate dehydrogenase complex dihydrolipoamide acyltransferase (E2) component